MSPFSLNSCALSCSIVRPDSLCKQFVLFAICKKIAINYCTLEMVFCMELAMCVSGCARIVRNYHHFAFRKPFLLKTKWHCKLSRLSFSFHFITFVSFHLFFFSCSRKVAFYETIGVYVCVFEHKKRFDERPVNCIKLSLCMLMLTTGKLHRTCSVEVFGVNKTIYHDFKVDLLFLFGSSSPKRLLLPYKYFFY